MLIPERLPCNKQNKTFLMPNIYSLLSTDAQFVEDYEDSINTIISKIKDISQEKQENVVEAVCLYIIRVMIGLKLSNLSEMQVFVKNNTKELQAQNFNLSLTKLKECKTFPTHELYKIPTDKSAINELIYTLDIYAHADLTQPLLSPLGKDLSNLGLEKIKALTKVPVEKNEEKPSFFPPKKSMTLGESKDYPTILIKSIQESKNRLFRAIMRSASLSEIESLIGDNANLLFLKDKDENTAFHIATLAGNTALFPLLIKHGLDKNAQNIYDMTPASIAVIAGQTQSLKTLMDMGVDLSIRANIKLDLTPPKFY